MTRGSMIAAGILLVVLTALPALGQQPIPYETETFEPAGEEQGQIQEATPCGTIWITGGNWGPGTIVQLDREYSNEGCPGIDTPAPADVTQELTGGAGSQSAASSSGAEAQPQAFAADEQGRIAIPVQVPADQIDDFDVTVVGVDEAGEPKTETQTFDVVQAASFVPEEESGSNATFVALAALLAAVILAVGFNWPSLIRRRKG